MNRKSQYIALCFSASSTILLFSASGIGMFYFSNLGFIAGIMPSITYTLGGISLCSSLFFCNSLFCNRASVEGEDATPLNPQDYVINLTEESKQSLLDLVRNFNGKFQEINEEQKKELDDFFKHHNLTIKDFNDLTQEELNSINEIFLCYKLNIADLPPSYNKISNFPSLSAFNLPTYSSTRLNRSTDERLSIADISRAFD